jgi:hypothetical protein
MSFFIESYDFTDGSRNNVLLQNVTSEDTGVGDEAVKSGDNIKRLTAGDGISLSSDSDQITVTNSLKRTIISTSSLASGVWNVTYSGFSSVLGVFVQPVYDAGGTINNERFATVYSFNNTSANGRVMHHRNCILGISPIEYSAAGVNLKVLVVGF